MVRGFSGFGFPKAHGAAFGLLAYQSTWLRVHYAPELLCALLNEQPMGFYPPDALIHDAQRRGIEVRPPDVNAIEADCTVEAVPERARRPAAGRPPPSAAPSCASGSATCAACKRPTPRRSWPRARPAARSATSRTSPLAPGPDGRRSSCSRGRGPATSWPAATAA